MFFQKDSKIFSEKIEALAKEELNDIMRVKIAKNTYLMRKKDELTEAREQGYPYALIAQVATEGLLEMGIPKTFIGKNKEGEEVTREVKISPSEIKKFIEPVALNRSKSSL